jgi:hypothetical protein
VIKQSSEQHFLPKSQKCLPTNAPRTMTGTGKSESVPESLPPPRIRPKARSDGESAARNARSNNSSSSSTDNKNKPSRKSWKSPPRPSGKRIKHGAMGPTPTSQRRSGRSGNNGLRKTAVSSAWEEQEEMAAIMSHRWKFFRPAADNPTTRVVTSSSWHGPRNHPREIATNAGFAANSCPNSRAGYASPQHRRRRTDLLSAVWVADTTSSSTGGTTASAAAAVTAAVVTAAVAVRTTMMTMTMTTILILRARNAVTTAAHHRHLLPAAAAAVIIIIMIIIAAAVQTMTTTTTPRGMSLGSTLLERHRASLLPSNVGSKGFHEEIMGGW